MDWCRLQGRDGAAFVSRPVKHQVSSSGPSVTGGRVRHQHTRGIEHTRTSLTPQATRTPNIVLQNLAVGTIEHTRTHWPALAGVAARGLIARVAAPATTARAKVFMAISIRSGFEVIRDRLDHVLGMERRDQNFA